MPSSLGIVDGGHDIGLGIGMMPLLYMAAWIILASSMLERIEGLDWCGRNEDRL